MELNLREVEERIASSYELPNRVLATVPMPLISVRTSTCQHAAYIASCIEGVLTQETEYPFEYIIGEDCSTDGTRDIVLEYARRYPEKIRVLTADRNVGMRANGLRCLRASRGKYIAVCEGDDCWTDPLKLQKQVAFLEAHPDYALCVGGYRALYCDTKVEEDVITIPSGIQPDGKGYSFALHDMLSKWVTQPLTAVYPNDQMLFREASRFVHSRDVHLFYLLLREGRKGFYFTDIMALYRIHNGGVHSKKTMAEHLRVDYDVYRELYHVNRDEFTRRKYFHAISTRLGLDVVDANNHGRGATRTTLWRELLAVTRTVPEVRIVLALLLPKWLREKRRHRTKEKV